MVLLTILVRELGVALAILMSLGRSRRLGPGDASRDRVCRKEDFRFFSPAKFSACSSCGKSGMLGNVKSG